MKLSRARAATVVIMALRAGYGVGMVAAPASIGRRWLGPAAGSAAVQVPLQGLGTREIVLSAGIICAALRGGALRPWLVGSIAGDLTDVTATVVGRDQLPEGSALATAAVGGGSALLSLLLFAAADR